MPAYMTLRPRVPVAKTLQINKWLMVDIAADGRIIGIETLSGGVDDLDLEAILKWVRIDPALHELWGE